MKQLASVLALSVSCVLAITTVSAPALAVETEQAKMQASDVAGQARVDMEEAFGPKILKQ